MQLDSFLSSLYASAAIFGVISVVLYFYLLRTWAALPSANRHANTPTTTTTITAGTGSVANQNNNGARTRGVFGVPTAGQNVQTTATTTTTTSTTDTTTSTILQLPALRCRVPSHVGSASAISVLQIATGTSAIAVNSLLTTDGLVSYKHSRAAEHERSMTTAAAADSDALVALNHRRDRARILSRLLVDDDDDDDDDDGEHDDPDSGNNSNGNANVDPKNHINGRGRRRTTTTTTATSLPVVVTPPAKGTTVVITIPVQDVDCSQQRRVLYLLATYYNLLVILAVPGDGTFTMSDRIQAIQQLRGNRNFDELTNGNNPDRMEPELSTDVLPDHRIVAASTVTGRVAFVRQLQRVELVLDFDPEVHTLLSRFGHRVRIYGSNRFGGHSRRDKTIIQIANIDHINRDSVTISKLGAAALS